MWSPHLLSGPYRTLYHVWLWLQQLLARLARELTGRRLNEACPRTVSGPGLNWAPDSDTERCDAPVVLLMVLTFEFTENPTFTSGLNTGLYLWSPVSRIVQDFLVL